MRELFNNRFTRKFCGRLLVGSASFVLVLMISSLNANAAGCTHHLVHNSGDLPDGFARIYENGRFYYYKVVPPCSGPSCGRSKPSSMTALPNMISNERSNSVTLINAYPAYSVPKPSSLCADVLTIYFSPSFDEPLRPPV